MHPVERDCKDMAVSPNNMAFLLNLVLPVVNFTIVMLSQSWDKKQKLSIFNCTILNDEAFANNQL